MQLISFNLFRTLNIPHITYIKPEHWLQQRILIEQADWVLFPEYWQVNSLVYGFKKRIFPSPSTYHLGHDKIQMSRIFEAVYPAHIPDTRIVAASDAALQAIPDEFGFPFVAKEVRSSMGQGVFLIDSHAAWRAYAQANTVWYVQEYLTIERDLRIVVIGQEVVCAYWREKPAGGFHTNIAQGGQIRFDDIPKAALELVRQVATELGIDHAGFDVAMVHGHPYLLEFNVYFGTQGLSAQGVRVTDLIYHYLYCHPDTPTPPQDMPPAHLQVA